VPEWYAGQCPIIEGDRVILAPGGDDLVIAVELATGQIVWRTPNPRGWKMTHASLAPIEVAGTRQYIYCGSGGVAGVAADDGRILWDTEEWRISIATVPTPVPVGDNKVFLSGGYNSGSMMAQLGKENDAFTFQLLFRLKAAEFGSAQHTPIFYKGYIYGVRADGQLVCLDLNGKTIWASGGAAKFGLGPYLIADGLIYLLNDDGLLTMAEATPAGYRPLAQSQVLNGHDCWAPLAMANGLLLARDLTRMVCLDVKGGVP
jgi:outer membrane protein assembly factor BamB